MAIRLTAVSSPLRSFQARNFRYLWLADSLLGFAEQMELVALAWFVLVETDSAFLVGLLASLRYTGTLFSPLYGVAVDRYDRKKVLAGIRASFVAIAALILALLVTGRLEVWQVLLFVGVDGMGRAFDNVARQAMLPDLVERSRLMNAVALTRTGRDITQIVGPIIGGFMLGRAGMDWTYALIIAVHGSTALLVLQLKPPARTVTGAGVKIWRSLKEAGSYIGRDEALLALMIMAFVVNLTAFTVAYGMMPVFARDVLDTDSTGLGILLGSYSAGSFLGSVAIAWLPQFKRGGKTVLLASLVWHGALLVFSQTRWFAPSLPVLALAGLGQSFTMVTMAMLLLSATSPELRGRVMGVRSLAVYGLPLGLLISGALADALGAPVAIALTMSVGLAFTILVAARFHALWRLDTSAVEIR
ncbi:MAG: MFS transporter [Chloroflexi bacterium]|nr:MFS transporter [Chloroflexota bacterium]